eukprot:8028489-Pyramimonas_sp.AAC.1
MAPDQLPSDLGWIGSAMPGDTGRCHPFYKLTRGCKRARLELDIHRKFCAAARRRSPQSC